METENHSKGRRKNMTYLIIGAVLLAVAAPVILVAMSVEDWSRDLSINRATTDPDAEHPLLRPLTQRFSVEELDGVLAGAVSELTAWSQPAEPKPLPQDSPFSKTDALAVRHLVRTTRLMRYRDDIWIVVQEHDAEKLRAAIESRSRVGKGDLGQNPRNIKELNALLLQRLVIKAPPPSK